MRIVLDTNILARAHQLARGRARSVLLSVTSGEHVLMLSTVLLRELERVLAYPRLLSRSHLKEIAIRAYLEFLAGAAALVEPVNVPAGIIRDPKDEPVLGTALAGKADVICTRDQDFYDQVVLRFAANSGIQVLTDLDLIPLLRFDEPEVV